MDTWRTKLDKALYEKNAFTDVLATAEAKTGVKRTYFVAGLYPNYFQIDIHQFIRINPKWISQSHFYLGRTFLLT